MADNSGNSTEQITFESLKLAEPIQRAVAQKGYTNPTPIQAQAIPLILEGHDIIGAAQTGTGKTAAFTLPVIQHVINNPTPRGQRRGVRALVITPVRELAQQVRDSIFEYSRNVSLYTGVAYGGVSMGPQIRDLNLGVDVLVATPGRLLDLYQQGHIDLSTVNFLVLDEADRMLDMGFIHDIRKVVSNLPAERQNLLFSATFSDEIRGLAKEFLNDPIAIDIAPRNTAVETVDMTAYAQHTNGKMALFCHLLRERNWPRVLVFVRTKDGCQDLQNALMDEGIRCSAIHGNKTQNQRQRALDMFKDRRLQVLIATDVAARGIDINDLEAVVNFEIPNVAEDFVHRIGRTGRAGCTGVAVSFVAQDERKYFKSICELIGKEIELVELPECPVNQAEEDEKAQMTYDKVKRLSRRGIRCQSVFSYGDDNWRERQARKEAARSNRGGRGGYNDRRGGYNDRRGGGRGGYDDRRGGNSYGDSDPGYQSSGFNTPTSQSPSPAYSDGGYGRGGYEKRGRGGYNDRRGGYNDRKGGYGGDDRRGGYRGGRFERSEKSRGDSYDRRGNSYGGDSYKSRDWAQE